LRTVFFPWQHLPLSASSPVSSFLPLAAAYSPCSSFPTLAEVFFRISVKPWQLLLPDSSFPSLTAAFLYRQQLSPAGRSFPPLAAAYLPFST
jgi:hypothetical protein